MRFPAELRPHTSDMQPRLLSFFSDFERAILADDPSPEDGSWVAERTVNYVAGLARMTLAVRLPDGTRRPRGTVFAQSFKLADGSPCLKAQFGWAGTDATTVHAIYDKPGCNWGSETRRLAAEWMSGPPVRIESNVESTLPRVSLNEGASALAAAAG